MLNEFETPVLSGSAVASVAFWASAASCLVCSVSVSTCLRACSVQSSTNAVGDFTPDNFWTKSKGMAPDRRERGENLHPSAHQRTSPP